MSGKHKLSFSTMLVVLLWLASTALAAGQSNIYLPLVAGQGQTPPASQAQNGDSASAGIALSEDAWAARGNQNPGVLPPNAKYRGLTYGEWGAAWWQAAFATPVVNGDHPLISGSAFDGEKGMHFLAGVVGAPVTIDLTVPAGTPLFFPVVNAECSVIEPDPFHGEDEAELRACANGHLDQTSGHFALIDGVAVNNLAGYRVESPLFEFGPLPEDNLLHFFGVDAPAGATSPSVDACVYLLLAPLSVGEHTLRFGGTLDEFGVSIDTTYNIIVVPKKP